MLINTEVRVPRWVAGTKGLMLTVMLLTLLSAIAYQGIRDNFFSCDDFVWLRNAQNTLNHPLNVFTRDIAGWFRPFGHLIFALNYLIFGLKSPVGYAAVSVLIHILSSYCVFALVERLSRHRGIALSAAAFFAIQHAHWEVTWASSVAEVAALFWMLLTLIWFLKWRALTSHADKRLGSYLLAHLAMGCSYLSAESAAVLPALLLAADVLYAVDVWKQGVLRALRAHLSFWVISAIYFAYEFSLQLRGSHLGQGGDYGVGAQSFMVIARSLLAYLVPKPLLLFIFEQQGLRFAALACWLGTFAVGCLIIMLVTIKRAFLIHAAYSVIWVLLSMLPFCGFTRFTIIDSRHFYAPSVGVALLFSLWAHSAYQAIRPFPALQCALKRGLLFFLITGLTIWNVAELWHEDAMFQQYASESHEVLTFIQQSYVDLPEDARIYLTGLYTPEYFIQNMLFVYYGVNLSQVSHVRTEKFEQLTQRGDFSQPTYLWARHRGKMNDFTPEQYQYALPDDGILDMGASTAQKYLRDGFSYPEIWADTATTFVWSNAATSKITVAFPKIDADLTMTLRMRPFSLPDLPQQTVEVQLNGQTLGTLRLHDDFETYALPLPKSLLTSRAATLQFQYGYSLSPKKATNGQSQETRQLAAAFDFIRFE